jgi:hypothetical protein
MECGKEESSKGKLRGSREEVEGKSRGSRGEVEAGVREGAGGEPGECAEKEQRREDME